MPLYLSAALRATRSQDIITAAGAAAIGEFWNGSRPSGGGAPAGTKLATVTFGSLLGTTTGGVLTLGAFSQANSGHVNGTPTFFRLKKSDGTYVGEVDIGAGAGNMQFTSTIQNGVDIAQGAMTITEGNAA